MYNFGFWYTTDHRPSKLHKNLQFIAHQYLCYKFSSIYEIWGSYDCCFLDLIPCWLVQGNMIQEEHNEAWILIYFVQSPFNNKYGQSTQWYVHIHTHIHTFYLHFIVKWGNQCHYTQNSKNSDSFKPHLCSAKQMCALESWAVFKFEMSQVTVLRMCTWVSSENSVKCNVTEALLYLYTAREYWSGFYTLEFTFPLAKSPFIAYYSLIS